MFEQSGTFKNEFIKLGIPAEDYDIQNNFGETDHVTDLFKAIEDAYDGNASLFDNIYKDDLIMAFFPCIYFETIQQLYFALAKNDFRNKPMTEQIEYALDRLQKRTQFHALLYKMVWVAYNRNLRLIIENPATAPNYLITGQNFPTPTIVDNNRMMRGIALRSRRHTGSSTAPPHICEQSKTIRSRKSLIDARLPLRLAFAPKNVR